MPSTPRWLPELSLSIMGNLRVRTGTQKGHSPAHSQLWNNCHPLLLFPYFLKAELDAFLLREAVASSVAFLLRRSVFLLLTVF